MIEKLAAASAAQLAALHARCFDHPWSEAEFASLLHLPSSLALGQREDGVLLGFVLSRIAADEAEILTVGVARNPGARDAAARSCPACMNRRLSAGLSAFSWRFPTSITQRARCMNEPVTPKRDEERAITATEATRLCSKKHCQAVDKRPVERLSTQYPAGRIEMPDRIEKLCIEKGLRMTEQRRVIARVLSTSADHPDAEELHRRAAAEDPRISLATVYRTVRLFEEAGIIERHDFRDGRSRYEEVGDDHHDHLIDLKSGEVIEFVNDEIERLQEAIARKLGYKLVDHRLELYGVPLSSAED